MLPHRNPTPSSSSTTSSSSQHRRDVHQELEEKTEMVMELKQLLEQSKDSCSKLRQQNSDLLQEAEAATLDLKSKLRNIHQEVEEKNEVIIELKEMLEQSKETCNKLRQENLDLVQEARAAKALRDEIDYLNERVRKLDRLETEVQRYRDRMSDMEFLKTRIDEVREENRLLSEGKSMLQEQLDLARKRCERLPELEHQLIQLKALSLELQSQQELDKEKTACLVDEVNQLRVEKKAAVEELNQTQTELKYMRNQVKSLNCNTSSSNLLEQLKNDASTRLLKLELENQKLLSLVDNMKSSSSAASTCSSSSCASSHASSSASPAASDSCSAVLSSHRTTCVTAASLQHQRCISDCLPSGMNIGIGSDFIGSDDAAEEMLLEEAGLLIFSPEATISEPDSGCVSLVGEINLRLEKMERENCHLRMSIQRLNESESRIRHLEDERIKCQAELRDLKSKLESDAQQAKQVEEQNAALLTAETGRCQSQVRDLSQQLEELQQGCRALESENAALKVTASSLTSLEERLQELDRQISELESENSRVRQEKDEVAAEAIRLKSELDQKDVLIQELGCKLSCLEIDNKNLRGVREEDKCSQEIRLQSVMEEQERLRKELGISESRLQSVTDELMAERSKTSDLRKEMEQIRKTLDVVNDQKSRRAVAITSPNVRNAVRSLQRSATDNNLSGSSDSSTDHHQHQQQQHQPAHHQLGEEEREEDDASSRKSSLLLLQDNGSKCHHSSDKLSSGTESELELVNAAPSSKSTASVMMQVRSARPTPTSCTSSSHSSSSPSSSHNHHPDDESGLCDDDENGDLLGPAPAISFTGTKFNPQTTHNRSPLPPQKSTQHQTLTFENKMTINLVTSSSNTITSSTTTATSNDISNKHHTISDSSAGKFTSRQTSLESSDMVILRSNCASSSSPSPTTPPSHHANSSPFIRGSYQSNSLNFGSLSRRAPLAVPIVGMRMNGGGNGSTMHHNASSPQHASPGMMPHAHITANGHLHGHYHYHYHHLHSVSAHSHSPNSSINSDHSSFVTVVDESQGPSGGPRGSSSNGLKTPENRMNSHHRHSIRRIGPAGVSKSPAALHRNSPRAISPTPSTVGTDSVWYEYGCV